MGVNTNSMQLHNVFDIAGNAHQFANILQVH